MVAIIFALIGIAAGAWGAIEVGTPAMLLMWVPCAALLALGVLSEQQRRREVSARQPRRPPPSVGGRPRQGWQRPLALPSQDVATISRDDDPSAGGRAMDRLRTPFFVLAVFCLVAAVGLEIGSGALVRGELGHQHVPVDDRDLGPGR